jgi:hypothetical protein
MISATWEQYEAIETYLRMNGTMLRRHLRGLLFQRIESERSTGGRVENEARYGSAYIKAIRRESETQKISVRSYHVFRRDKARKKGSRIQSKWPPNVC